jgi:hypothetical protein
MPRHGIGIDISTLAGSEGVVTTIDDFVFESFSAGQMHPIRTSSRTNLITYSEDFTQSSWDKNNVTVASNSTTAPNSTLTADKITKDGNNANDRLKINDFSISNNTVLHFSAHVKDSDMTVGGKTTIAARVSGGSFFRKTYEWGSSDLSFASNFDSGTRTNEILEDLGNGWYRIGFSFTSDGTEVDLELDIDRANTGATTSLFAWGFQLEQDGFVSNYIPTSGSAVTVSTTLNDTSNVWDFDGTDIMIEEDPESEGFWEESYPDGATLPELVLNGDYEELGSEILPDGGTITNAGGGLITQISGNSYSSTSDGTSSSTVRPKIAIATTSGKRYKLILTRTGSTTGDVSFRFNDGSGGSGYIFQNYDFQTTKEIEFVSQGSVFGVFDGTKSYNITGFTISLKQVDPNDRWSLGTGWSIEDGKAVFSGTDFANLQLSSAILNIGDTYELTLTAAVTNGSFKVQHSFSSDLITESSSGTYSVTFTATATAFTIARASVGSQNDFTIDNVTVREYAIQPLDI